MAVSPSAGRVMLGGVEERPEPRAMQVLMARRQAILRTRERRRSGYGADEFR